MSVIDTSRKADIGKQRCENLAALQAALPSRRVGKCLRDSVTREQSVVSCKRFSVRFDWIPRGLVDSKGQGLDA